MKTKRFLAVAVMLVMACSMAMAQSIKGVWFLDMEQGQGFKFTFNSNNVCKIAVDYTQNEDFDSEHSGTVTLHISADCRYTVNNGNITFGNQIGTSSASCDFECSGITEAEKKEIRQEVDEKLASRSAGLKSAVTNFIGVLRESSPVPYSISGNTLTINDGGHDLCLTRVGDAPAVKSSSKTTTKSTTKKRSRRR